MKFLRQHLFSLFVATPAIIALAGSIVYFAYGLNQIGAFITALLSAGGLFLFYKQVKLEKVELKESKAVSQHEWLIFIFYSLSWLLSVWFLYKARSDRPLITPWEVVTHWYFVLYALGFSALFFLAKKTSRLFTPALILQSLLLYGTAVVVYRLGYGFDPFIHEAAVNAIEKLGQIKPLTPYYLGQYSIIIVFHALTKISATSLAKVLVPGLAAFFLPLLTLRWLQSHFGETRATYLAALFCLVLPATIFILTTPQSLAYIFLLFVLLWPSHHTTKNERIIVWLCALAALVTQPIAGIPALLAALTLSLKNKKIAKIAYPLILALFVLALPAAFYFLSRVDSQVSATLIKPDLVQFFSWLIPHFNFSRDTWLLNFSYLYNSNWGLIIILLSLGGIIISFKNKSLEIINHFIWPALALLGAGLIASMVNFHFLIDYERSDYPQRILIITAIFSFPLILILFHNFSEKLAKANKVQLLNWLIVLSMAASATLYLSYPRFDAYNNSHGYASSKADTLAVQFIEKDSHGEPYTVLADQQVSAAALHEFGFNHYYNNLFYYPVPTGGPLYQYYLQMVEKPSLNEIKTAMNLSGVKRVYLVLDSYWWNYKKLVPVISALARKTEMISDGQVTVFFFTKN